MIIRVAFCGCQAAKVTIYSEDEIGVKRRRVENDSKEQRYQQVLKILETLQDGDGTMVEDRDTNLSRGQQPRVNLARIVYNQSKIYLLDDPLAGLDAHVSVTNMDQNEKQERIDNPKQKANILSKIFFAYTFQLFGKGYKKELQVDDLYKVLPDYESKTLGDQLEEEWEKETKIRGCVSVVRLLVHCFGLNFFLLGCFQLVENVLGYLTVKILKLNQSHLDDISVGKILTLLTKDVQVLEVFVGVGSEIWTSVIKTVLIAALLYNRMGAAAVIGVLFVVVTVPLQIYFGKLVSQMKMKLSKKTDERLQITQETVSAIRVIKMYTWENVFISKICQFRKNEINKTFKMFLVKIFTLVIGTLTSFVVLYIILSIYTQSGNYLTSENTYYMLILIQSHLSATLTRLLPNALLQGAETLSAINRIESIVKKMETEMKHTTDFEKVPRIFLKDVCVSVKDLEILQEIDLNVEKRLIVVTGPIGSGKSTLLKTILQDYRPDKGDLKVQGTVSYASQEPWLFPSTIKQNILFGQKCDEQRYQQVLKICALLFDLEMLQDGDSTMVEDRGTNLSRGQQARINLARAVYNQSDIYLLDDPLAGLDAHVGAFVFEECIKQFLKDKLVLLVTHNQSNAKDADRVVRIEGGKLESAGNLSVTTDTFCDSITDRQTEQALGNGSNEEDGTTDEGSKLIANNIENKNLYHERRNSGGVKWKVYRKYLAFGGGGFVFSLVFATYLLSQFVMSLKDKLLSDWINMEDTFFKSVFNLTNKIKNEKLDPQRGHILYVYTLSTDLENQMTSVERGLEYAEVKQENTQGLRLEDWPKLGGVKTRYSLVVGMYKDEDIWRVLEEYGLKKVILSLDYGVVGGGSNFSVGEKQLICLARAIIQKNQIVVLDEATANIDPQTEEVIYQTIREKFASCTVFTIAHKLKSVLDNDKILVLDKGEVIEYDEPSNLLADESTTFHKMAEEMGTTRGDFRFLQKTKKVPLVRGEGIKRGKQCPSWSFVFGLSSDLCRNARGLKGGPKRVRLEGESRESKPKRRGADLRFSNGRFSKNGFRCPQWSPEEDEGDSTDSVTVRIDIEKVSRAAGVLDKTERGTGNRAFLIHSGFDLQSSWRYVRYSLQIMA
ncbi:hypothetical protein GEV33_001896 [Tenebrio molitor]|uniref:Multidrug resistance-associated protein lethal(2)03659 n=1 Tax=Tenebrio molitor TaxID=7067 RepID=A0A8J6LGG6_TENMO|nr:hypothetical protein GEV33_001896 [Tenebrio molitor]